MNVVFEIIEKNQRRVVNQYLREGKLILVVEPFHAYHHTQGVRFFPPALPAFADDLIKDGRLHLLKAGDLAAGEIYQLAADKAVAVIDHVVPEYKKEHAELFDYVSHTLKSPAAEDVFKMDLCNRLAEFYSENILIQRVVKMLGGTGTLLFYPDMNVRDYLYVKNILSRAKQDFFEHPDISFPWQLHFRAFFENLKEHLRSVARLSAQTFASMLLGRLHRANGGEKKKYSLGMTIVSPSRQLADNRRGPDFIIDNNKIHTEDVVYLPLSGLTDEQNKRLENIPGSAYYPPKAGRFFSHPAEWSKLLRLSVKKNFLRNGREISSACNTFFNYFSWSHVLNNVQLKHFITHCDFGANHIGRNLALNQAGVQTWYFTDSMNFGCNLMTDKKRCAMRHPFWTYLHYDHFVTWDELLARYFKEHPGSFKESHIVGCLWSGHIKKKDEARDGRLNSLHENMKDNFVIAAFDTTYTRNGLTSYAEGIAFAEDLLKLVNNFPAIRLLIKEKKNREMHYKLDPVLGPKLLNIYKEMDGHPGITTCSEGEDASDVISIADMVISFPFTSTTFEALSANRPAVWHDPMGFYKDTPYAKAGGVTTHNYDELKAKILEIKSLEPGQYRNPIAADSPLLDPYRDGKAIGRFRELLASAKDGKEHLSSCFSRRN